MTHRRLGLRFGFIYGLRELRGGCANLSRLASSEKTCQEFNFNARTLGIHKKGLSTKLDALAVSLDARKYPFC